MKMLVVLATAACLWLGALAARGKSLAAFDGRCIPGGCVAPPSNTGGILSRRALPAGRLARLGATPDFHHGLQALSAPPGRDYPVQPVPFTSVHLTDVFWAPRIETNRTETIPFAFEQCELT